MTATKNPLISLDNQSKPQFSKSNSPCLTTPPPPLLFRHRTRIDKVNAELVTLTYGTVVAQLCKDFDNDYPEVNKQLDKMGYNIGLRLIEDYLAKSNTMKRCANFRETADMISRVLLPCLEIYLFHFCLFILPFFFLLWLA